MERKRRRTTDSGRAGLNQRYAVHLAASPLAEGIGGRYFEDVSEAGVRTESPGMLGTGVADYALEPRYARMTLWEVSTEMLRVAR